MPKKRFTEDNIGFGPWHNEAPLMMSATTVFHLHYAAQQLPSEFGYSITPWAPTKSHTPSAN